MAATGFIFLSIDALSSLYISISGTSPGTKSNFADLGSGPVQIGGMTSLSNISNEINECVIQLVRGLK